MISLSLNHAVSALEERETVDKFKACTERISGLGFDEEDSERVVGQAFGWGKQAYWLNKKKDQVPNLEQVWRSSLLVSLQQSLIRKGACRTSFSQSERRGWPDTCRCIPKPAKLAVGWQLPAGRNLEKDMGEKAALWDGEWLNDG